LKTIHQKYEEAVWHFNSGNLVESELISRDIYNLDPNNQEVAHLLAVISYKNGSFKKAYHFIDAAIQISSNSQFLNTKGNILVELGNFSAAESAYIDAISANPQQIDSYNNLAILLRKVNRAEEAMLVCKNALKLNRNNVSIINTLGLCYFDCEQFEVADHYFSKTISIAPTFIPAHLNLVRSFYSQGKFDDAIRYLKQLLEEYPNIYQIKLSLADIFRDEKYYLEAISEYKKVLVADVRNFDASNNLGVCLLAIGEVYSAIEIFSQALNIRSDDLSVLRNLCICFSASQNYQRIVKLIDKYERRVDDCDLHQLYIYAAITYWLTGDKSNVKKYLDLAKTGLKVNPLKKSERFLRAYYVYLNTLCDTMEIHVKPDFEKIYFVGDSHTLVHNQQVLENGNQKYFCVAKLILGCKIWHLIELQENQFKFSLNCVLKSLPNNSKVVFNFGEIDCRENEGIILQIKKNSKNVIEICEDMVFRYTKIIEEIAEYKNFSTYLMGIPAPVIEIDGTLSDDQSLRIHIISQLNKKLKSCCKNKKSLTFVDVYSITTDFEGKAKPGFHLDDFHLSQSSCQLAFDQLD